MPPVIQIDDSQLIFDSWVSGKSLMLLLVGLGGFLGCASARMPAPEQAAKKYASALEAGDADVLYEMLTSQARNNLTREELAEILRRDKSELRAHARQIVVAPPQSYRGEASLYLENGRAVELSLESDGFHLSGTGVMPARPLTPEQAVLEFSNAVRARDYERIRGMLSSQGQTTLHESLVSLDDSLAGLSAAVVDVRGDRAEIELPSGLRVELVRVQGVWRIEALR